MIAAFFGLDLGWLGPHLARPLPRWKLELRWRRYLKKRGLDKKPAATQLQQ